MQSPLLAAQFFWAARVSDLSKGWHQSLKFGTCSCLQPILRWLWVQSGLAKYVEQWRLLAVWPPFLTPYHWFSFLDSDHDNALNWGKCYHKGRTWSVTISACPSFPGLAVMTTGFPGSLADKGTRSQFVPPSFVCSKIAGRPTIQPSEPLKLMELNL